MLARGVFSRQTDIESLKRAGLAIVARATSPAADDGRSPKTRASASIFLRAESCYVLVLWKTPLVEQRRSTELSAAHERRARVGGRISQCRKMAALHARRMWLVSSRCSCATSIPESAATIPWSQPHDRRRMILYRLELVAESSW
jgi:hypothetical protein